MTLTDVIFLNLKAVAVNDYDELQSLLQNTSTVEYNLYADHIYFFLYGMANLILRYEIEQTYKQNVEKLKESNNKILSMIAKSNFDNYSFSNILVTTIPIFKPKIFSWDTDISATDCKKLSLTLKTGPLYKYRAFKIYTAVESCADVAFMDEVSKIIFDVYSCYIFKNIENKPMYLIHNDCAKKGYLINRFLKHANEKPVF